MIIGTGIDIAEVARISAALERFEERFLRRIFTPSEIAYCRAKKNCAERLAARFAAKEAAMKAIGTGLRHGVSWQDFEIGHEAGGRPSLTLSGKAADFARKLGTRRISISLSHTQETAIAQVILED